MIGYVTLEEANLYVATHYVEDSDERTHWEDLDDSDKQVLLLTSFEAIERLPFPGRKTLNSQSTMFPRYPSTEVPIDIKAAQIENAVAQSDSDELEDAKQYERLWNVGVSSYSIGNLSETIGTASFGVSATSQSGITSAKAKKILIPFLSGGYSI
nr:MAG TPA: Putative Head Tail Connector Protein [Caudoviricetes sp.]